MKTGSTEKIKADAWYSNMVYDVEWIEKWVGPDEWSHLLMPYSCFSDRVLLTSLFERQKFPLSAPNSLILNMLYAHTKEVLEMFWTASHFEDQSEIV